MADSDIYAVVVNKTSLRLSILQASMLWYIGTVTAVLNERAALWLMLAFRYNDRAGNFYWILKRWNFFVSIIAPQIINILTYVALNNVSIIGALGTIK